MAGLEDVMSAQAMSFSGQVASAALSCQKARCMDTAYAGVDVAWCLEACFRHRLEGSLAATEVRAGHRRLQGLE